MTIIQKIKKIILCILAILIECLTLLILNTLKKNDYSSISNLWLVGNVWTKLLGVSLGILVILMLAAVFCVAYGWTGEKVKLGLSIALIGDVLAVILVICLIYSGAARFDAEFTLQQMPKYEDLDDRYEHEENIISDDGILEIKKVTTAFSSEYVLCGFELEKKSDQTVILTDVNYSIFTPSGDIYTGTAELLQSSNPALNISYKYNGSFYVCFPTEKGTYDIDVSVDYYDATYTPRSVSYKYRSEKTNSW